MRYSVASQSLPLGTYKKEFIIVAEILLNPGSPIGAEVGSRLFVLFKILQRIHLGDPAKQELLNVFPEGTNAIASHWSWLL